ncbi:MAG: diaminobutyrate acetyltransferase [Fibrobacterota bacterium]
MGSDDSILFRKPGFEDGLAVAQLVENCPPLDLNTTYYYYMMCRDFSETSVVAELNGEIVGYISAYRRPAVPSTLFVWQVAVSKDARGRGLAGRMLSTIIESCSGEIDRTETTITPSNTASQAVFKKYAEKNGLTIEKTPFLKADHFGGGDHEPEDLYTTYLK